MKRGLRIGDLTIARSDAPMPRQGYVPDAICREFVNRDPKDHLIEGTVGSVDTNQPARKPGRQILGERAANQIV